MSDPEDLKSSLEARAMASLATSSRSLNPAEWTYERLVEQINSFEAKLKPNEEIGGRFVAGGGEPPFHIEDISYWGPDMLMFHGRNSDGRPVQLVQHYTQLSVLLVAMPVEKEPRRIGFLLKGHLEDKEG